MDTMHQSRYNPPVELSDGRITGRFFRLDGNEIAVSKMRGRPRDRHFDVSLWCNKMNLIDTWIFRVERPISNAISTVTSRQLFGQTGSGFIAEADDDFWASRSRTDWTCYSRGTRDHGEEDYPAREHIF